MNTWSTILGLGILMLAAGCAPVADDARPARPPIAALIVLDLSPSLSKEQRVRSATIAGRIISKELPPRSSVVVYALESNMLDAMPLLSKQIPDPITTSDGIKADAEIQRWTNELETRVKTLLEHPASARSMTSCYVKSLTFASDYFAARPPGPRLIAWIGDLIEDCREPAYVGFRLGHVGSRFDSLPARYAWPRLRDTNAWAVIVPRNAGDRPREADTETIGAYWRKVATHLTIGSDSLRIGTPALLGIAAE